MLKKIQEFYKIYGYYHCKMWAWHLLIILCLIVLPFEYFLWSILVHLILMPITQTISHDYICHEYIQPRNKVIEIICLIVFYGLAGRSIDGKRAYHVSHHRFWKTPDLDPPQQKMKESSFWRYALNFQKPVSYNLPYVKNNLFKNNSLVKKLDSHSEKIFWIFHGLLFIILPIEWFAVISIYYIGFGTIIGGIHDQIFHRYNTATDRSWYLPIFGNQAWHIKHHEESDRIYYGPGLIKWVNPSMYIHKIFFKPTDHCLV